MSHPLFSTAGKWLEKAENAFAILVLAAMVLVSIANALFRVFGQEEIPGAGPYIQHLNLLLTFSGAVIGARAGRHLTFSTGHTLTTGRYGWLAERIGGFMGGLICALLAYASFQMARSQMESPAILPGNIPVWVFQLTIPIGFGLCALHFLWRKTGFLKGLLTAVPVVLSMLALSRIPTDSRGWMLWPVLGVLLLTGFLGAPIFAMMGGAAMVLFFMADIDISAVPTANYDIVIHPTMPVIPLFAFAGYLLATGGASKRLIKVFNTWFGWLPGGAAIVTVLVCAFFTTFTGASGVTILGLGGLLLPLLLNGGYPQGFSLGLVTTSGSLGMLFPPSLPIILYGVTAGIAVDKLFLGGIVPGFFLIFVVAAYGLITGARGSVPRTPFVLKEARAALWDARYELALPLLLFGGYFGGYVSLAEAAAITALYIFFVETVLKRDLRVTKEIPEVMLECTAVIGALLIIFGAALGLTNYLVDAEIPMQLTEWVKLNIHERWLFILALNVVLLLVGSLMEGLSAIAILVPLITPIGEAFGFSPIHLSILFLANLEVGFLLPPVGLNLFLSSMRFERPLASLYRPVLPFLLLMFAAVLIISYFPSLTLWLPTLLGK